MTPLNAFHINSSTRGDLSEDAVGSHEVVGTAAGLILSSSSIETKGAAGWQAKGEKGLSIGVVRGRMKFDLADRWKTQINGAFSFCLSTPEPLLTSHFVESRSCLRGVFLHAPDGSLERLGIPYRGWEPGGEPRFHSWGSSAVLDAIANQISGCPYEGTLRTLYLEAKSLELLVAVLATGESQQNVRNAARFLTRRDTERLMHGRDILLASLSSPPSLDELARSVGMSTSRLTAGFRQLFSMSVVEFIQEQRLGVAMTAISEGRASVSQAAFEVGYTPAHFSTLFRRRYGYPPSRIARR